MCIIRGTFTCLRWWINLVALRGFGIYLVYSNTKRRVFFPLSPPCFKLFFHLFLFCSPKHFCLFRFLHLYFVGEFFSLAFFRIRLSFYFNFKSFIIGSTSNFTLSIYDCFEYSENQFKSKSMRVRRLSFSCYINDFFYQQVQKFLRNI